MHIHWESFPKKLTNCAKFRESDFKFEKVWWKVCKSRRRKSWFSELLFSFFLSIQGHSILVTGITRWFPFKACMFPRNSQLLLWYLYFQISLMKVVHQPPNKTSSVLPFIEIILARCWESTFPISRGTSVTIVSICPSTGFQTSIPLSLPPI